MSTASPARAATGLRGRVASPPVQPGVPTLRRDALLALGGSGLAALLLTLAYPPLPLWPLALPALAPWAVAMCAAHRVWLANWLSFLVAWGYFLVNLSWLYPVTDLGYVALAGYLALYFVLAAWAVRTARRFGIATAFALPVVWTACEYARAWVMSGFPWLFVAHCFHDVLPLIQISDLVGAYGVTFLAAAVSGTLADWLLAGAVRGASPIGLRQRIAGLLFAVVVMAGALGYGFVRLADPPAEPGPRVAVIQHDFPLRNTPPYSAPREYVFSAYFALAAEAAATRPDLVVFPETTWASAQNIDFLRTPLLAVDETPADTWRYGKRTHEASAAFARGEYGPINDLIADWEARYRRRAAERPDLSLPTEFPRLPAQGPALPIVLGSLSIEAGADSGHSGHRKFNSALVYDATGEQRAQRYDKVHLVVFGEYVPFRNERFLGIDLHPLYLWLNKLSPFSEQGKVHYSLTHGRELTVFDLAAGGRTFRFGTPICYEDVMPYLIREYVWQDGRRRVDFLLNISNDGWFLHSAELAQHLAICVFRAVENRVSIARAVNTGISGFIDGNGRKHDLVMRDGRAHGPGVVGWSSAAIGIERRTSPYGVYGDWFARICLLLTAMLWLSAMFTRWVLGFCRWLARLFGSPRTETQET